jgi:hypothetical protein
VSKDSARFPPVWAVALLAAVAPGGILGAPATVVVPLRATAINAGQNGRATLIEQGERTQLVVDVSGVPTNSLVPVRVSTAIHEGDCDDPVQPAAYVLDRDLHLHTTTGQWARSTRGAFTMRHSVAAPAQTLLAGRYLLVLRRVPADGGEIIFCGPLRRP